MRFWGCEIFPCKCPRHAREVTIEIQMIKDAKGEKLCSGVSLPIRFTVGIGGTIVAISSSIFHYTC